ncbi:hypothetical protein Enr10x_17860 [Gimesia panareensis]|uniref:Uncharacterized protein n=2 Tax=Gimesia panareensis TaxID=2527978 RepID=A0A518A7E0_9PLAN|nr:hypothetical protein Enr10x_17860 [Gimesia panareensis]QDU50641.1 hypothetical protein Pan110_29930 [Gimesia panareensis]
MIRLQVNPPRFLLCLCCLFVSGCATNQAALFSVAPEYDTVKMSALAQAAASRRQSTPDKTHDDVKSDQITITGFNKYQNHQKSKPESVPEPVTLPPLPEPRKISLEFDEKTDFQPIELTGVRFPEPVSEAPVEAKKPVIESESEPEFYFVQEPAAVPPAPETPLPMPETAKPDQKKSPRLVELGLKPLTSLTLNTKPPTGDLPTNTAAEHLGEIPAEKVTMGTTRDWQLVTKDWVAAAVPHNPLYFEEPYLERYGYNYGAAIQPFISAGRFFGRIPALPYMIGAYPLYECQYTLGYERPGNCPPYQVERLPVSGRGALFESLTVTGLVFLIP